MEHVEKHSNLIPTRLDQSRSNRKGTLEDEVIVLVELRWQNTNTFRSTRIYFASESRGVQNLDEK